MDDLFIASFINYTWFVNVVLLAYFLLWLYYVFLKLISVVPMYEFSSLLLSSGIHSLIFFWIEHLLCCSCIKYSHFHLPLCVCVCVCVYIYIYIYI